MSSSQNDWMKKIATWFQQNPDREFYLTEVPISELMAVGIAGWIAGAASLREPPAWTKIFVEVAEGAASVGCIVRRAAPAEGRPLPSVFLMDGGGPLPPVPPAADPSRAEETLCAAVWVAAQTAAAIGLSLRDFMMQVLAQSGRSVRRRSS
jgi:hypothetical protein